MYFDDHNPPHFHAIYAGNEAEIAIEPIEILEGKLPARGGVNGFRMGCATSARTA